MQKDFLHVLPVEEVISRLLDVSPLPQESKRLDKLSGGPILAETIMATETLPPANRSGMDGYAVQASDLFGASEANPVWLDCVGEIAIDRPPNFTLQSGQCAAIVTGGYLPEGADAVIMVEHTKPFGAGVIEMRRSVAPGEYVMQKGDDAQEGTPLLERGTKLRAQEIGLLAALGITEVPVIRRPRVSILSTGDELVSPEQTPRPGQIRDVNTLALSAMLRPVADVSTFGIARIGSTADGFLKAALAGKRPFGGCRLPVRGSSIGVRDLT
ncbi:MAG: molybdopterin molybdotransferase MoeA [Bilophila wadsworthia]